jgi:hypothetical protein
LPPRFLFDPLDQFHGNKSPSLRQLKRRYLLERTPIGNRPVRR